MRNAILTLFTRSARSSDGTIRPVQTAALPWRRSKAGEVEVLLVTSRSAGRWILPKGWPMRGKSLAEAAAIEAYEEGGVLGIPAEVALGSFEQDKKLRFLGAVRFIVMVHPLEVDRCLDTWPEQTQRQRKWFGVDEATEAVTPVPVGALLRHFRP